MKSLRDGFVGTICVAALVVCGFWYAREPDLKNWSIPLLGNASSSPEPVPDFSVKQFEWSADGQRLLTLARGEVGPEGPLLLHRIAGEIFRQPVPIDDLPMDAALAPDGRHVAVATRRGELLWIELDSLDTKRLLELPETITFSALTISSDGATVAAAAADRRIYVLRPQEDAALGVLEEGPLNSSHLRFSRDGSELVSASTDGSVRLWKLEGSRPVLILEAHDRAAMAAEFLGGRRLITAGSDDTVRIWDLVLGREEWRGQFECGGVSALAVAPDGRLAAWGGLNRRIIVWDLERHRKTLEIATTMSPVSHLDFSPDGRLLAASGMEVTIHRYDPVTGIEQPGIDVRSGP